MKSRFYNLFLVTVNYCINYILFWLKTAIDNSLFRCSIYFNNFGILILCRLLSFLWLETKYKHKIKKNKKNVFQKDNYQETFIGLFIVSIANYFHLHKKIKVGMEALYLALKLPTLYNKQSPGYSGVLYPDALTPP